jgi:adenosylmethionine-8-amino-7-oxononanoate aminotransferase
MANPLACAVAKASIDLLLNSPWQQRVSHIESQLKAGLAPCLKSDKVADVRIMGAIGVVEMKEAIDIPSAQAKLIEQGVWLRPFGKLLYTMPPFVISDQELHQITHAMVTLT